MSLTPVLLAATTIVSFFAIAHIAVRSTPSAFRGISRMMLFVGTVLVLLDPAAGAGVVAAVLLARRLALSPVPATLPVWVSEQR